MSETKPKVHEFTGSCVLVVKASSDRLSLEKTTNQHRPLRNAELDQPPQRLRRLVHAQELSCGNKSQVLTSLSRDDAL